MNTMKVFLTTTLDGGGYLLVSHTGRFLRAKKFQRFPDSNIPDVVSRKNLKTLPGIQPRIFVRPVIN